MGGGGGGGWRKSILGCPEIKKSPNHQKPGHEFAQISREFIFK